MKKNCLTTLLLAGFSLWTTAQNIQLHYDWGQQLYNDLSSRPAATATIEMFKPDKWGSTYMFTDLDLQSDGMAGAYWEISREFNISHNKQWAIHTEYNGGLSSGRANNSYFASRFQHAALLGGAWNWHNGNFSKTFSVQVLYKYFFKNNHLGQASINSFQLTEVWGMNLAKGLLTFSGFCDMWYHPNVNGKLIFLSEPQLWLNLNTLKGWNDVNLSIGGEVELSNNFVWNAKGQNNKFYAIPTLAAKWTF